MLASIRRLFAHLLHHVPGLPYLFRHQLINEVLLAAEERGYPRDQALRIAALVELEIAPRHTLATAKDILALHKLIDQWRQAKNLKEN